MVMAGSCSRAGRACCLSFQCVVAAVICQALASCIRVDIGRVEGPCWCYGTADSIADGSGVNIPERVFITGIEYPSGYDWTDPDRNATPVANIFLMSSGERLLNIRTGRKAEVSSDPDAHTFAQGHIYTWYCEPGNGTVVKKDGETVFRCAEDEDIRSLYVKDGNICSLGLGQDDSFPVMRYRRNGIVLYQHRHAVPLSGIHESGGKICFSFTETSAETGGGSGNVYMFRAGDVSDLTAAYGLEEIAAAEMLGGKICIAGRRAGERGYVMICGEEESPVDIGKADSLSGCRLMWGGRKGLHLYAEKVYASSGEKAPSVWNMGGYLFGFSTYEKSSYCMMDADTVYNFAGYVEYDPSIFCCRDGERVFRYGSGITVRSGRAAAVSGGRLYFIYSGKEYPYSPYMAVDREVTGFDFNGCFTGVYVY